MRSIAALGLFCLATTLLLSSFSVSAFSVIPSKLVCSSRQETRSTITTALPAAESPAASQSDESLTDDNEGEPNDVNEIKDSSESEINENEKEEKKTGDKLRAETGIRPSVHPITINAIAYALKKRARGEMVLASNEEQGIKPIDVFVNATKIVTKFIEERSVTLPDEEMYNVKEQQTIAGRIVGVIMRFQDLEESLKAKVAAVDWISKYKEWGSFGVVPEEVQKDNDEAKEVVAKRIKSDPLFAINRAEGLLAIFLETVELPKMIMVGETAAGGSEADFLDEDRKSVLLESSSS